MFGVLFSRNSRLKVAESVINPLAQSIGKLAALPRPIFVSVLGRKYHSNAAPAANPVKTASSAFPVFIRCLLFSLSS
jgi:hypothetical protein